MPAPPSKDDISGSGSVPSNGQARAGFGALWEYVTALLGLSGNAADARTALGAAPLDSPTFTGDPKAPTPLSTDNDTSIITSAWAKAGFAVSLGVVSYVKVPTWLGGWILQWGASVVASDGAAQAAFSYPLTFPTAVRTIVGFNGDNGAATPNKTAIYGTTAGTTSIARFVYIDTTTGAGIAGASARINWIALGN